MNAFASSMESPIETRCLHASDFAVADKLRAAAGWNQTLADWRRMVVLDPAGCFVALDEGKVVGTATTTSYGLELAWIGMVLVDPARRNRGIGRRLLLHCLEYLRAKGVRCIKLDATPAGQILYEKLGFQVEWPLARWMAAMHADVSAGSEGVAMAEAPDVDAIEQLDREAIGVARPELLRALRDDARHTAVHRRGDEIDGFGFLRSGINADYIGPIVAQTDSAGRAIVGDLLGATQRPVYWDIPDQCAAATAFATELGFAQQRPLLRMFLGTNDQPGRPELLWAISDPATG